MNENIVNDLREITEETDISTMLKSTLGGYTKKSVMEYLSYVRQQQSDMRAAFAEELQHMQAERELLQAQLEQLRYAPGEGEAPKEEVSLLREQYTELEKDMNEALEKIAQDEKELEDCRSTISRLEKELSEARSEALMWKEELEKAGDGTDALPEEKEDSEETEAVRDGQPLNARELYANMFFLENTLELRTRELEHAKSRLEIALRQEQNFCNALEDSRRELRERQDQSECVEQENDELSRRLSEQMEANISLTRENARLRALNTAIARRSEAAQVAPPEEAADEGSEGDEAEKTNPQ